MATLHAALHPAAAKARACRRVHGALAADDEPKLALSAATHSGCCVQRASNPILSDGPRDGREQVLARKAAASRELAPPTNQTLATGLRHKGVVGAAFSRESSAAGIGICIRMNELKRRE